MAELARYRAKPKSYSTFSSPVTTDAIYAGALRKDRARISAWLNDPTQRKGLAVPFSSNRPVGVTYSTPGVGQRGSYAPSKSGVFVLQKSAGATFFPKTAKLY